MCGIAGFYGSMCRDRVVSMCGAARYRGPDNTGIYSDGIAALGNNRLSIIDLASGDQPIFNEDRSLVIVYNGELFNYLELKGELVSRGHVFSTESDTETVLHAYEEFGEGCLGRFNGFFAFAIWDVKGKELFIARDRLGIKPLYIHEGDGAFAFASEAKSMLKATDSPPEPDWEAIGEFFSYGYLPSPYSPFKGVRKMPPGTWMRIGESKRESASFWEPLYGQGGDVSHADAVRDVGLLIEDSVRMELMADVPVGLFLSGGLDSSAVACFAKRLEKDICAYVLSFEERTHDEGGDARLVARHLGLECRELKLDKDMLLSSFEEVFNSMDEPFGDSTVLPLSAISKFARRDVKVVLTGWGGDELFAGYPTYKAHKMASICRSLPPSIVNGVLRPLVESLPVSDKYMSLEFKAKRFIKGMDSSPELQHAAWMGYFDEALKDEVFTPEARSKFAPPFSLVGSLSASMKERRITDRIQHLDAKCFLEGNGLFQADRMTMGASLEARVPLLNNKLFDYVSALPESVRMPSYGLKPLLKAVLSPHLPASIVNKPKKGFGPPSATWLRTYFTGTLKKLFSRDSVCDAGIFNFKAVDRMVEEHLSRRADHGRSLWAMMSFELWRRRFICGETISL